MARKDKEGYKEIFDAVKIKDEVEEVVPNEETEPEDNNMINELLAKKKKVKFDDLHTRKTFSIDNELYKRMMNHFDKKEQGYQTKFIKVAITKLLDELEQL